MAQKVEKPEACRSHSSRGSINCLAKDGVKSRQRRLWLGGRNRVRCETGIDGNVTICGMFLKKKYLNEQMKGETRE